MESWPILRNKLARPLKQPAHPSDAPTSSGTRANSLQEKNSFYSCIACTGWVVGFVCRNLREFLMVKVLMFNLRLTASLPTGYRQIYIVLS